MIGNLSKRSRADAFNVFKRSLKIMFLGRCDIFSTVLIGHFHGYILVRNSMCTENMKEKH